MRVEKTLIVFTVVVLVAAAVIAGIKLTGGNEKPAPVVASGEADASLVVIGIQGLEAAMVERLAGAGRLPNLARLIAGGATGTYETLGRRTDGRIVWTSLVTGMLPENQGVGGRRMSQRGEMVDAPLMPSSRTVGALWTYLSEAGERVGVLGWPGTWPVESIEGIMVGPYSTYVLEREHGGDPAQAVSPPSEYARIDPLMLERSHYKRRDLSRFVNMESSQGLESLVGQNYIALSGACSGDRSMTDLAIALAAGGDVGNIFVCLPGLDAVSQRFWHYMETEAIERADVDEDARRMLLGQIEALGGTVALYYEYVDELVGEIAALAGQDGSVVIITDHGYRGVPLDASGSPMVGTDMHSEQGLWIASGPRVGASVAADHGQLIDIAPSIMAVAGMEVPDGLDGEARTEILVR